MPLDFPSSATTGSIYTGTNGVLYTYDGVKWTGSTPQGSIIPSADLTYDLGSTTTQWRSLYVGTSTIYLGGTALSVSDGQLTVGGSAVIGGGIATTSTLINGTATVQLIVGGGNNPYTLFPEYDGGQLYIQGAELATTNSGTVVISAGPDGGNIFLNTYGASLKQWAFNNGGNLIFPDGSTSTGASIYVPYATSSSFKISTQLPPIGPPPYGATTFEVTAGRIILPTGNGFIQSGNYTDPWSLDSANKGLYFPNNSRINYYEAGGALSTGSMQVDVRSGGIFQIRLNDSGKTWEFDTLGTLNVPGTIRQGDNFLNLNSPGTGIILLSDTSTVKIIADYATNGGAAWTFDTDLSLRVPGNIVGFDPPMGYERLVLQPSPAVQDSFLFYVDQTAGTFNRAGIEMPYADEDKAVTLAFPHNNNTVGYIFNQGTDTISGTALNNALNIMMNAGDVKITALSAGPTYTSWTFQQNGGLKFPDGSTSTGATIYVPYATSSSFRITTEFDVGGPPYFPLSFEVTGDRIKLPNGNGLIQSGPFTDPWALDSLNKSFTFPNNSDIEYGDGSYHSTGTLQVRIDFGGEFKINLHEPNKTWTFNNSGNIVFPDGTTQTTAYVSGSVGGYTPSNVGNWLGTPTVATYTEALDELAFRTTTLESIAGVTGTNVTNVFMYNSNASFSMTQNVEYKIPFDTAATGNDSGDFQTTSSQFTPQIAGWYLIETHLNFGGVWSGNVNISVYKNNNQERLIGSSWIGNGGGVGGGTLVYSNGTTDIFEIRATQQSGGVQALEHGAAKTWFQATWMKS